MIRLTLIDMIVMRPDSDDMISVNDNSNDMISVNDMMMSCMLVVLCKSCLIIITIDDVAR